MVSGRICVFLSTIDVLVERISIGFRRAPFGYEIVETGLRCAQLSVQIVAACSVYI